MMMSGNGGKLESRGREREERNETNLSSCVLEA